MPGAVSTSIRGAGDFTGAVTSGYYLTWNGSAFTLAALSGSSTNVLVNGGTVGTSGVGVVAVALGTVPTSAPADEVQLYAADYTAGDCRLQLLSETGTALWLGNGKIEAKAPASGAGNPITIAGSAAVSGNTNGGNIVVQLAAKSGSGADGKFVVKAATASPGGNLTEWQDNSDTALTAITSSFGVYIRNSAGTQSTTVSPAAIAFGVSDGTGLTNPGSSAQGSYAVTPNGRGFGVTYGTSLTNSPSSGIGVAIDAAWAGVVVKNVNTSGYAIRVESGTSLFEAAVLSRTLVEANTAGSGSPNVLTAAESGTLLTNEGSTAQNYHTLPSAAAGLQFDFVVQDSDGMRIVAATGDTIRNVATVSATAGYIQSTVVGSTLTLKAINATEWVVTAIQGTWTIDS